MPKRRLVAVVSAFLFFHSLPLNADRPSFIGWAQEAHPDYSEDVFLSHIAEQKKVGANLVWIGHNNPGYVDKNKAEPGLSYAVYEAILDEHSPHHADALEQAAAVKRLLDAVHQQGLKAVLAIGYQIQMGPEWNAKHPEALRRQHDGPLFIAGGPSASFYSTVYQQDILDYYHWVYREWVVPYKDTILMLNLADEPHGGDYSEAADAAFKTKVGYSLKEADKTDAGILQRGAFENNYIAQYAAWSAGVWKAIDPAVHTTMSFCGSHGRFTNFEPSIAALFRDTPDTFDITFDAFLIDNQPGDPIDGKHVSALSIFLRQVGALSQKYNKRVWLWPEANNWILSQWSPVKGNISDALFGVKLLRDMSAAAGIHLGGLAVWNLDVKEQGLFRDTHPLIYDPQRMFEKISEDFKTESDPVLLRQDLLVWIPESEADFLIGRKSYDYADRIYLLDVYAPLLERGLIPTLSSDNAPDLKNVQTLFLLSKYPPHLEIPAAEKLESWVRAGGTLVCNYPVVQPASILERLFVWTHFYGVALMSTLTQKQWTVTTALEKGKIIWICDRLNEKRRNIVHQIPPEVVEGLVPENALPVDAGIARGLLVFPYKRKWVFYNTNPESLVVTRRQKSRMILVYPDGSLIPIKPEESQLVLLHGSWLEVSR